MENRMSAPSSSELNSWTEEIIRSFDQGFFCGSIETEDKVLLTNLLLFAEKRDDSLLAIFARYAAVPDGEHAEDYEDQVAEIQWYPSAKTLVGEMRDKRQELGIDAAALSDVLADLGYSELDAETEKWPGPFLRIRPEGPAPDGFVEGATLLPLDFNPERNVKGRIALGILQGMWGNGFLTFCKKRKAYLDEMDKDIMDELDAMVSPLVH